MSRKNANNSLSKTQIINRNRRSRRQLAVMYVNPIPDWKSVVPQHRSVRYGVIADQSETDILVRYIMYAQCVATTTTAVVPLAQAIRFKRFRCWFTAPSIGSTRTATIEWNAGGTGFLLNGVSESATTMSTTEPVCLDSRPPTESLGSWYQGGSTALTNSLFSMSAPAGAIIQIDYDWVPNFTEAGFSSVTVSGAVAGTLYCLGWNSNILALPPLNSAI